MYVYIYKCTQNCIRFVIKWSWACTDMPLVVSASVPTGGLRRGKIIAYILVAIRPLSLRMRRRQWVYWYMGGGGCEGVPRYWIFRSTSQQSPSLVPKRLNFRAKALKIDPYSIAWQCRANQWQVLWDWTWFWNANAKLRQLAASKNAMPD